MLQNANKKAVLRNQGAKTSMGHNPLMVNTLQTDNGRDHSTGRSGNKWLQMNSARSAQNMNKTQQSAKGSSPRHSPRDLSGMIKVEENSTIHNSNAKQSGHKRHQSLPRNNQLGLKK